MTRLELTEDECRALMDVLTSGINQAAWNHQVDLVASRTALWEKLWDATYESPKRPGG